MGKTGNARLEKSLGLFETTMYGVGIILGAGIYALLGQGAGLAGNAVWISFIIAAVVSAFTGLSYCELNSMMPKEAAEYNYTKRAFNRKVAFVVGWVLILSLIVAASAVSLGFAGYFQKIVASAPVIPTALAIIAVFSALNLWGIKESSNFNIVATLIEGGGLVAIVIVGLMFFNPSIDLTFSPQGFTGVMAGAALMFFAFIGFQDIANMSEETRDPKSIVPKAMLISLAVSTVLYILVALAAVSIVGWEALASSGAPLSLIIDNTLGSGAAIIMSIVALFSTGNTILICLIVASRMIYGISRDGSLPDFLSRVHPKTRTPYIAILITMLLSIGFLFAGDIGFIANVTTTSIFVAFVFVNLSVIVLRYTQPREKRTFRIPLNIGRFPVLALFGLLSSIAMLIYTDINILIFEALLIFVGIIIYNIFRRTRVDVKVKIDVDVK
ncbi:MAG: amino acid permease [Candidatus Aenigmarchaeota archaeon]|nr:amino acid permease [Candidatus Aenigmarchaeota archaeon]